MKNFIKSLNFRTKLIFSIAFINVFILFVSSIFFYIILNLQEQESYREMQTVNINTIGTQLEALTNTIKDVSQDLASNNTLLNVDNVDTQQPFVEQLSEYNYLNELLTGFNHNNIAVYATVYYADNSFYSGLNSNFSSLDHFDETGFTMDTLEGSDIYWSDAFRKNDVNGVGRYFLGAVRQLINFEQNSRCYGALGVYVSEMDLRNYLLDGKAITGSEFYITNSNAEIISGTDYDIGDSLIELLELPDDEILQGKDTPYKFNDYTIYSYDIGKTGWKLFSVSAGNVNILENQEFILQLLTFGGLLLAVIILVDVVISTKMNNKIKKVFEKISDSQVSNTNEYDNDNDFKEELQGVINVYKTLHDKNKSLTEELLEKELSHKNATLLLLQSQINSHFLYNTLDVINWMAIKHKADDINHMVKLLSKFYRMTLSKGNDIITVKQELEHARTYLELEQNRFEGSVTYEINYSDESAEIPIIKLILQPIVENAILHGLMEKDTPGGIVSINANIVSNTLVITVEDDGVGITQPVLDQLNAGLPTQPQNTISKGSNYGLSNIRERLGLYYKDGANIVYDSSDEGSCVTISISLDQSIDTTHIDTQ